MIATALAVPSVAGAQVFVPPPPTYIPPPPPVYVPARPFYYGQAAPPPPFGSVPPHVYIRERIRWHLRRAARVMVVAAPPLVVVEAAPPTVYVVPAPRPIYLAPLPQIPPPIVAPVAPSSWSPPVVYAVPAPELVLARPRPATPQWTSKMGLGVRGTGQVIDSGWSNLGIGGELLYRASPHLVTEVAGEYQRSTDGSLARTDIPITVGLRVHIGKPNWVVSPYFVFAAGLDIGLLDYKFTTDTAYYLDGQLGGGLELRLGRHFAITADARLDGKKRLNSVDAAVASTTSINGKAVHPLADEYGGQFRLGAAVYF